MSSIEQYRLRPTFIGIMMSIERALRDDEREWIEIEDLFGLCIARIGDVPATRFKSALMKLKDQNAIVQQRQESTYLYRYVELERRKWVGKIKGQAHATILKRFMQEDWDVRPDTNIVPSKLIQDTENICRTYKLSLFREDDEDRGALWVLRREQEDEEGDIVFDTAHFSEIRAFLTGHRLGVRHYTEDVHPWLHTHEEDLDIAPLNKMLDELLAMPEEDRPRSRKAIQRAFRCPHIVATFASIALHRIAPPPAD